MRPKRVESVGALSVSNLLRRMNTLVLFERAWAVLLAEHVPQTVSRVLACTAAEEPGLGASQTESQNVLQLRHRLASRRPLLPLRVGVVPLFCGHGVGKVFHASPAVMHTPNGEPDVMHVRPWRTNFSLLHTALIAQCPC